MCERKEEPKKRVKFKLALKLLTYLPKILIPPIFFSNPFFFLNPSKVQPNSSIQSISIETCQIYRRKNSKWCFLHLPLCRNLLPLCIIPTVGNRNLWASFVPSQYLVLYNSILALLIFFLSCYLQVCVLGFVLITFRVFCFLSVF